MRRCLVHTCFTDPKKSSDITFHQLPKDKLSKLAWLNAIKRKPSDDFSGRNVVCSKHFLPEDFQLTKGKRRVIKKNAVPSQHLPIAVLRKHKVRYEGPSTSRIESNEGNSEATYEKTYMPNYDEVLDSEKENIPADMSIQLKPLPSILEKNIIPSTSSNGENLDILPDLEVASFQTIQTTTKGILKLKRSSSSESGMSKKSRSSSVTFKKPLKSCTSSTSLSSNSSVKRNRKWVKMFHTYSRSPSYIIQRDFKLTKANETLKSQCRNKKRQIIRLKNKIVHLKDVLIDLKKKNLLSDNAKIDLEKTIYGIPQALMKRYIRNLKRGKVTKAKFPEELRSFALTLNFYSTKAYEYVRKTFSLCLPSQSVIRSWYANIDCSPGYSTPAFDMLKDKVKEASVSGRELLCSLIVDEMAIKKQIDLVGSKVYGYVDIGCDIEDDIEATEAYVIMVVGINSSWKIPIAYFFIRTISGSEKANIIKEAISRLYEINVHIISVTCDGPSSNFTMFKELGCNLKDISNIQCWFRHPSSTNKKIYAILDTCHMLKLIRNNWCNLKVMKNPKGEEIKWHYITKLYDMQQEVSLNIANKLKASHINWQRQKMKVNLAAQTLSSSVADAIEFLHKDLPEKMINKVFQGSEATVEFIRLVDEIFDCLNSRNPFAMGFKSALRKQTESDFMPKLLNAVDFFSKCTDVAGKPLVLTKKQTPFLGFITTIKSTIGLYETYVKSESAPLAYLLTYKFSQDHLELYFCWIRSRNGWTNNPTAFQFMTTARRLLLHNEIKKITGNCIPLDTTEILTVPSSFKKKPNIENVNTSDINILRKYNIDFETIKDVEIPLIPHNPSLSDVIENVVSYIAGFVVRMAKKKIYCTECLESLEETCVLMDDIHMKLILKKDRGGLLRPSMSVRRICREYELNIRRILEITNNKVPPESTFRATLMHNVTTKFLQSPQMFPSLEHHANDVALEEELHKKKIIEIIGMCYLKVRMFYIAKKHTETVSGASVRQLFNKLVLFKHH